MIVEGRLNSLLKRSRLPASELVILVSYGSWSWRSRSGLIVSFSRTQSTEGPENSPWGPEFSALGAGWAHVRAQKPDDISQVLNHCRMIKMKVKPTCETEREPYLPPFPPP